MNKLEKLIAKLCPNGVEYKPLGDLLDYEQPTKYIVHSTEYNDSYATPVLTAGQTFILGYTDETDGHYLASKEQPAIIFDDFTTATQWVDFEFKVKSSAMKILTLTNPALANIRYVYFAIKGIKFVPGEHSRHWIEKYSKFEIPIPPLPVQEEIVRMLDEMTGLIDELEQELAARKQQYEWYRDQLLKCDDRGCHRGVLRDILVSLCTGLNPRQNFKLNEAGATCPYVTGKDVYSNQIHISEKTDLISERVVAMINRRACIESGDVMFASTGCGTVGRMAPVLDYDQSWAVSETMYMLKPKKDVVDQQYLIYALSSASTLRQYEPKVSKGSVPHLKVNDLLNVEIYLPPLSEQKKIACRLNDLDKLCNSMTDGLPGEIALRKQQYEYYRDRLLTFKRVG